MNNSGIVILDKPKTTNYYEFAYEHLGCDSIVSADTIKDPGHSIIYAYALDRNSNNDLHCLFEDKYDNEKYVIMHHISEREVYAID